MIDLKESVLDMSEFEAIRLVDSLGISQEEAGAKMKISQSTFARILNKTYKKLAQGIINGKAIKIEE